MRFPQLNLGIRNNFTAVFGNRDLTLLLISNIGLWCGAHFIIILSPLLIVKLGGSILDTGLVFAISGAGSMLFIIPSGIVTDIINRKKIILFGLVLSAVVSFLFTRINEWFMMIPLLILFRWSFSLNFLPRFALITDRTNSKNRAGVFGIMRIGFPIGGFLGLLGGGILIDTLGWASTLSIITIVIAASIIPALFIQENDKRKRSRDQFKFERRTFRTLITFLFITALVSTSVAALQPLLPIHLIEKFGANNTMVGVFFAISYLPFFTQMYSGAFADKFGKKKILLSALGMMVPLYVILSTAGEYFHLALIYAFINLFYSMVDPASQAFLMDKTPTNIRGLATSMVAMGARVGYTIGPGIGAYLWATFNPSATFYASTLLIAITIPLILTIKE